MVINVKNVSSMVWMEYFFFFFLKPPSKNKNLALF